jgi:hypothetical protein
MTLTALFKIRMPANSMSLMIMILSLAAFDFFSTEKINAKIFSFSETDSYTPIFE